MQAILFSKDYFSKRSADHWLKRNGKVRIKPFHETLQFYRARLRDVNEDKYDYIIKQIAPGIKAVFWFDIQNCAS